MSTSVGASKVVAYHFFPRMVDVQHNNKNKLNVLRNQRKLDESILRISNQVQTQVTGSIAQPQKDSEESDSIDKNLLLAVKRKFGCYISSSNLWMKQESLVERNIKFRKGGKKYCTMQFDTAKMQLQKSKLYALFLKKCAKMFFLACYDYTYKSARCVSKFWFSDASEKLWAVIIEKSAFQESHFLNQLVFFEDINKNRQPVPHVALSKEKIYCLILPAADREYEIWEMNGPNPIHNRVAKVYDSEISMKPSIEGTRNSI